MESPGRDACRRQEEKGIICRIHRMESRTVRRGLLSAAEHTGNRYAVFHEISSSVGNIRTFIHLKNHHLSFSDAAFITVAAGGRFRRCPLDI